MSHLYQHFNQKQCRFFPQPDLRLAKLQAYRHPDNFRSLFVVRREDSAVHPPILRRNHFLRFTMKSHSFATLAIACLIASPALAAEFHVSPNGNDAAAGSVAQPFKTISAAALKAMPGDSVTVHAGTYRERINPPRGGTSPSRRITYQAAKG